MLESARTLDYTRMVHVNPQKLCKHENQQQSTTRENKNESSLDVYIALEYVDSTEWSKTSAAAHTHPQTQEQIYLKKNGSDTPMVFRHVLFCFDLNAWT